MYDIVSSATLKGWMIFFLPDRTVAGKVANDLASCAILEPALQITEDVFQMMQGGPQGQQLMSHRVRDCYPILGFAGRVRIGIQLPCPSIDCADLEETDRVYLAELVNRGLKRAADTRVQRSGLVVPNVVVPQGIRRN